MIIIKYLNYFQYNSFVILTFFFISFGALVLNFITRGKTNTLLFSSYRSALLNPLTYLRMMCHVIGHENLSHFTNNFLIILLVGPMIEEKYGSFNLFIMMLVVAIVTGSVNSIFNKNKAILGASGICFMLIVLSSFVNITNGKIPLTFVLICIFYIVNEIFSGLAKKDHISHSSHLLGALCGAIFGLFIF